ncbi:MAG: hypothetical protein VX867_00690, partial [Pseudomonadota bacterium]|nr:hypothetical protein [Pseudomonadota bacterium]
MPDLTLISGLFEAALFGGLKANSSVTLATLGGRSDQTISAADFAAEHMFIMTREHLPPRLNRRDKKAGVCPAFLLSERVDLIVSPFVGELVVHDTK